MFSNANLFDFRGPFGFIVEVRQSVLFLAAIWVLIGFNPATIHYSIIAFLILMGSVVLHELGHAWACKVQGIPVREVVIFGGGGYCLPGRALNRKEDEFVTAMGPIVNLAIWAVASMIAPHVGGGMLGWFVWTTASLNLFLALFNLMPAMPLDGGRLFQLIMLRLFKPRTAIRIAGFVGLVVSVVWAVFLIVALFFGGGMILLFFPDFARHWQMFREGT